MSTRRLYTQPGVAMIGGALLLLGTFVTMAGCADTNDPLAHGRASYEHYCASCHGLEGKGNGDLLADLNTLPGDLTGLTDQNNGHFPVDAVYSMIDGRLVIEAHGTREMPVWGNIWSDDNGMPVDSQVVERRINELVEYIRTLQQTS